MTQEEKQLLLKDLCARLPYGVKCDYEGSILSIDKLDVTNEEVCGNLIAWYDAWPVEKCKPYLRPMSSMTNEEKVEYKKLIDCSDYTAFTTSDKVVDWLNKNHFDYRGLIDKGLALEATEDMYKINILTNPTNSWDNNERRRGMIQEEDLLYSRVMDGKSLVYEVMRDHGTVFDDAGNQYWWDTLDESKKYQVRKYEYCRPFQYPVVSYRIKEL